MIFLILTVSSFGFEAGFTQNDDNLTKHGEIYSDIFSRSIPVHMIVGKSYTVQVPVKNTGESSAYFKVLLITPGEFIHPRYPTEKMVHLDRYEVKKVKFPITPIKTHIGELEITVKLYVLSSTQHFPPFKEVDNASKSVYEIKNAFSIEDIITTFGVMLIFILFVVLSIKRLKH